MGQITLLAHDGMVEFGHEIIVLLAHAYVKIWYEQNRALLKWYFYSAFMK
jgi:hypothetical protein